MIEGCDSETFKNLSDESLTEIIKKICSHSLEMISELESRGYELTVVYLNKTLVTEQHFRIKATKEFSL